MSTSRSALERENRSLRQRIDKMQRDHAAQLHAKNRALELARDNVLSELGQSFPHLPDLISWLSKAHHAASVLRSPTGDGRSHDTPTPLESGASTRNDRDRLDRIDRKIKNLIGYIQTGMSDRGPLDEAPPVCNNPNCPMDGWAQPYDAEACASCGDDFGKHRPKRFDLTRIGPKAKRCWTRGCPAYSKVRQCEHSI